MLKFISCLLYILFTLPFLAQKTSYLEDGSFDEVMFHQSEASQHHWTQGFWVHYSPKHDAIQRLQFQSKQENVLQLNFNVSSIKVNDNYITSQLNHTLEVGKDYKVSFLVSKDKFSGYPIKHLTAFFTTSIPHQNYHKTHQMKNAALEFSLDSVSTDWILLSMNYTAFGGEQYFQLGSLGQTFNMKESLKYGVMGADATYNQNIYNSVYYIDDVAVELDEKTESNSTLLETTITNPTDYYHYNKNLLFNSGFEQKVEEVYYTESYVTPGGMVAPYVYSVNNFEPRLYQTDSNAYRSEYQKEQLPYMGNSMLSFRAYTTNKHHTYQEVIAKHKGTDYDTWYHYETMPSNPTIPKFEKGSTICMSLKDSLRKDSVYYFSIMLKLDAGSSYGLDFLGFHALNQFPSNTNDSIWKKVPDEIIPVADALKNNQWIEKQIRYQAKGGESFIALSAVYPKINIYKNQNFAPVVFQTCGPNTYNCFNYNVYYRDSLFANYYLDNVVMLAEKDWIQNASKIYDNIVNQVEVMFLPMEREGEWKDQKLLNAQNALIGILEVLRTNDAICVLNENKNDPLILDPFSIINKKKIIRKLNQPKLVRKVKNYELDANRIYFSGEETPQFNNHLIVVSDGKIDFGTLEFKLQTFCKNGGYFTLIFTGVTDDFEAFNEKHSIFPNVLIIDASDKKLQAQLLKRILRVN